MKTASRWKMSGSIWKEITLGGLTAVLLELVLIGIASLLLVNGILPNTESSLYGYMIIAIASALTTIIYCRGEPKIMVALGVCVLSLLVHCALNIIFFSGTFQQVGIHILTIALGGIIGLLPGMRKKPTRKYKIRKRM